MKKARGSMVLPLGIGQHTIATVNAHFTDAIRLPSLVQLSDNVVLARFETLKVAAALGAVRSLLDSGTITSKSTLVDSSSGIYALALAMACHRYGLRCHIVASTTVTPTLRTQLEILGATVDQMPPSDSHRMDQHRRVAWVQELLARNPDMHWMQQYHDPVHYLGYTEVAELVQTAFPDTQLTIVASVGTGASSAGLILRLRERDPAVQLVGVEPFGSVSFGAERFSDPEAIIAGIGSTIRNQNIRHELYDQLHWVSFRYAMAGAIALLRDHAVFAGLSTGAAYLATAWEAQRRSERTYLLIGADTGHRYVEQVFARHREADDPSLLAPVEIESLDNLTPPWSVMPWRRRVYQASEQAVPQVPVEQQVEEDQQP